MADNGAALSGRGETIRELLALHPDSEELRNRIGGLVYKYSKPITYVYAFAVNGYIKIGESVQPKKRRRTVQMYHVEDVEMLACFPSSLISEKEAHSIWRDKKARGEWFERDEEIVAWLRGLDEQSEEAEQNHQQINCRIRALLKMRRSPPRPFKELVEAEKKCRCGLCGNTDQDMRNTRYAPGFYCRSCCIWLR